MGVGCARLTRARREAVAVGLLCAAWYVLSSASNVVGKLALGELPLPLTLAGAQLWAAALLTPPLVAAAGVRGAPLPPLRALLPLALAKFLTTLLTQVSIWKVPVSYAHTVKATTPLWTAALSWLLWGERVSGAVGCALALIALGVCVASATELSFDLVGLGAALGAAALLSLQHLYSKRALRASGVHHLRLLAALSALAGGMLLPLWAWAEGGAVWAAGAGAWARGGPLLAAGALLAWLQALAAFSVLSRVSPLAYGVASAAKRAAVVGASLVVLRNPAPPANIAGMALAAAGVLVYNRAKARARPGTADTWDTGISTDSRPLLPV